MNERIGVTPDGTVYDTVTGEVLEDTYPPDVPRRVYAITGLDMARKAAGYLAETEARCRDDEAHARRVVEELEKRLEMARAALEKNPLRKRADFYRAALVRWVEENPAGALRGLGKKRSFEIATTAGPVRIGVRNSPEKLVLSRALGNSEAKKRLLAWAKEQQALPEGFQPLFLKVEVVDVDAVKRFAKLVSVGVPDGMELLEERDEGYVEVDT